MAADRFYPARGHTAVRASSPTPVGGTRPGQLPVLVTTQSQLSRPMSSGYHTPGVPSTEPPHACVHDNDPDTRNAWQKFENNTHDDDVDCMKVEKSLEDIYRRGPLCHSHRLIRATNAIQKRRSPHHAHTHEIEADKSRTTKILYGKTNTFLVCSRNVLENTKE